MKTEFLIALGYQKAKSKNRLVTLISRFANLGIALGIATLLIVLSAMNGFERELYQRVLTVVPQIQIYADNSHLANYPLLSKQLAQHPDVIATAPHIDFTAMLEHNEKFKLLQISGIDKAQQQKVSNLYKYILNQGWKNFAKTEDGIILGSALAKELSINNGDWINLLISKPDPELQMSKPETIQVQVVGIIRLDGQLDHSYALMPLGFAQKIFNYQINQANSLEIKLKDPLLVNTINLSPVIDYPQSLISETWQQKYGYMYNDIQMIRHIIYMSMILVIGIACFNIVSTLIMTIKDKQADIAIMKTLGASRTFILKVFITFGILSGLKGCIIGILLGCIIATNLTPLLVGLETLLQTNILSGGIYFVDFLPSELHFIDITLVFLVALCLSFLASLYPAYRATKLHPAVVLSGY